MTGKPLPWLKLTFYKLYMLAHQCNADGVITLSPEEICWKLHISQDELAAACEALARIHLFRNNGRGPEIPAYIRDGNISTADRADTRQRVQKHRKMKQACNADVTPRESESDRESESEGESDIRVSQSSRSRARARADRLTDHISKSDLTSLLGIRGKIKSIIQDPEIHPSDLIAEYARNMQRMNKGKVREPGSITGMNLLKHEYPKDEWYAPKEWAILPDHVRTGIDYTDLVGRSYKESLDEFDTQ